MTTFEMDVAPAVHEEAIESDKRFKMCYVDFDTVLFRAAKVAQEDYISVRYVPGGFVKRFKTRTDFGIARGKILDTGWLGSTNEKRINSGKSALLIEDFVIEDRTEISPDFESTEAAIDNSVKFMDYAVGKIKKSCDSDDYKLVISAGDGNYRDNHAKTQKYKGNRGDKPVLFSEVREAFIDKYKSKVELSSNCEAEDLLGHVAKKELDEKGKDFENWDICISFIDKDVKNVYAPSFNYDKPEDGWRFPTEEDCLFELISQVVAGDPTDDITGLPNLTEEVTSEFGMRKSKGCGKTTGENLIKGCSVKEMWERAVFAYQSYYRMDTIKWKDFTGADLEWTWLDYMQETAILVKMQEYEGHEYSVKDVLDGHGILYEDKLFQKTPAKLVSTEEVERIIKELKSQLESITKKGGIGDFKKSSTKPIITDTLEEVVKKVSEIEDTLNKFYLD